MTSGNYNTLDSGDRLAELLVSSGNTHLIYKYSYAYYVFKKLERLNDKVNVKEFGLFWKSVTPSFVVIVML